MASEGDYMYHHRQLKIGTGGLATGCDVTVIYLQIQISFTFLNSQKRNSQVISLCLLKSIQLMQVDLNYTALKKFQANLW